MNAILRHTLNTKTAKTAAAYVASPLRRVGAGPRALGLQTARVVGGA